MNIKNLTIISAVAFLTACGGGGGGDAETSPAPTQAVAPTVTAVTPAPTSTPQVTTPAATTQVSKTSDLKADDDFTFTSSYQVSVSVNRNSQESAYLNICREFKSSPTGYSVNYDSCVLQTTLEDGKFAGEITLTNDINELIVSVWLFTGNDPIHQVWDRAVEGDQIVVN
ncbi:hypothetical protein OAD22_08800 [Pseudomonadales bacterium]|nr:hypothetical protein [Pseudomonadales bacterium]MDA9298407.1 hypothetical protein [Pseudomonadales bacterium]MDA9316226.1 hypothetical protein [Pseudomonadales bacterium]MDB4151072.1 hypothetical protein [Pseudomonadales bacterium]MDB9868549.1 hypothetical protein [Pseudomonadales bacterium]